MKPLKPLSIKGKTTLFTLLLSFIPFLGVIILSLVIVFLSKAENFDFSVNSSIILLQSVQFSLFFLIPCLLLMFFYREKKIPFFKKIDFSILFYSFVFLILIQSIAVLIQNYISLKFFQDRFMSSSYEDSLNQILNLSPPVSFIMIAVFAPLSEEFYFRGIFSLYGKFINKKIYPVFYFLITSVFFSLSHFDFIRLPYLVLISLGFAFIFYLTENLWYTAIFHFTTNFSAWSLYLLPRYFGKSFEKIQGNARNLPVTPENLKDNVSVTLVFILGIFVYFLGSFIVSKLREKKLGIYSEFRDFRSDSDGPETNRPL